MNSTKPDQTPVHIWTPWGRMDAPVKQIRTQARKAGANNDVVRWLARNLPAKPGVKLPA